MRKNGNFWKPCLLLTFVIVTGPLFAAPADDAIALGQQKQGVGDLDGALAAYNQALSLIPKDDDAGNLANLGIAQASREAVLMAKGDIDDAFLDELVKDNAQNDAMGLGIGQENLFAWIIRTRKGQRKLAKQELSKSLAKNGPGTVQLSVDIATAKYYLGRVSETELLAIAQADDKKSGGGNTNQSEEAALYFIGMKRLIAGDRAGALKKFKKADSLKSQSLDTSTMVRAEIKKLTSS